MLPSVVEGALIWLRALLAHKLLLGLRLEFIGAIVDTSPFFFVLDEVLFFGFVFLVLRRNIATVNDEIVINALEGLFDLFVCFNFDFACGSIFVLKCLRNLLTFQLDLWLLIVVRKRILLDLFELHESIAVWPQVPNHMLLKQKVVSRR